jgi:hypothetical protein
MSLDLYLLIDQYLLLNDQSSSIVNDLFPYQYVVVVVVVK